MTTSVGTPGTRSRFQQRFKDQGQHGELVWLWMRPNPPGLCREREAKQTQSLWYTSHIAQTVLSVRLCARMRFLQHHSVFISSGRVGVWAAVVHTCQGKDPESRGHRELRCKETHTDNSLFFQRVEGIFSTFPVSFTCTLLDSLRWTLSAVQYLAQGQFIHFELEEPGIDPPIFGLADDSLTLLSQIQSQEKYPWNVSKPPALREVNVGRLWKKNNKQIFSFILTKYFVNTSYILKDLWLYLTLPFYYTTIYSIITLTKWTEVIQKEIETQLGLRQYRHLLCSVSEVVLVLH